MSILLDFIVAVCVLASVMTSTDTYGSSTDAYGLYFEEMKRVITSNQAETSIADLQTLVLRMWEALDHTQKAVYENKATEMQTCKYKLI